MTPAELQTHLTRVLETKAASLRRIAEAAGLDPAQLSRFKSSGSGLSEEKLAALGKTLRRFDPAIHSSIEPAHIANLGDCLHRRELSVFVGAGLSHLAPHQSDPRRRLPLWPGFAEALGKHLGQSTGTGTGADALRMLDRLSAASGENKVREAVPDVLDSTSYSPSPAHLVLARMPWLNVITTNYDPLLANVLQPVCRTPIVREEDYRKRIRFPESKTDRRILNLVHLHGDLEHPHTLFSSDYRRWPEKHPQAYQFLRDILSPPHCVLFIGYGLGDPHLRDLLDMVREMTRAQNRLYAWMWNLDSLDRELLARDNILTGSIDSESGWADALELLEARLEAIEEGTAQSVESPVTLAARPDERGNYTLTVAAALERVNLTQYYIGETHTADAVTLRDLFVAPDVVPAAVETPLGKTPARPRKAKASPEPVLAGELHLAGMEAGERPDRCSSIQAWLEKHSRLVLLGEPGQGKSTLLRHLVLEGLAAWKDQPQNPPRFPFFIQLSHWERDCLPGKSMREYALDLLEASYGLPRDAYEKWLEPGVLWLLDGVDEVRDPARRATLIQELQALAAPEDAIVVTSRPAGYFDTPLGEPWVEVRLAPLSEPQSLEMLTKIFALFQRLEGLAVSADSVFRQLGRETSLARLRRNALQLTMIAVFFRSRRELPRDRWVFYTFATEYLMRTRAAQRSEAAPGVKTAAVLPSFDLSPNDVHDLFKSLAIQMMQDGRVTLHRDELLRLTRAHFSTRGRKGAVLEAAVENVMRAAQGLNGVLVERGRDLFGFVHLTYQEFYAAWWLNVQQSEAEQLIPARGLEETWAVVWDLYVLSLDNNWRRLCHLHTSLPGDDARLRRLRWLGLGPAPWEQICADDIFPWACAALKNVQTGKGAEVLRTLANWERTYPDCIRTALTALLSSGENDSRHTAAQALGEQAAGRELLTALLGILSGADDVARGFAEYALAIPVRAADPVVTPELRKLYADPAASVQARAAAARALGGAVPALHLWPVPTGREEVVLTLKPGVDISFLKVTAGGAPFWLQRTQVTQEQWQALMDGENPSRFKGPHLPVESVDWQQSQDFCARLAEHPAFAAEFGRQWQPALPLEKDWEAACRAGKEGDFNTGPDGDGKTLGSHQANIEGNYPQGKAEKGVYRQRTTAAGSFPPNDWGFHDLHGNVWEWCDDWYDKGARDRSVRGGCFHYIAGLCAAGVRYRSRPDLRYRSLGFRVSLRSIQSSRGAGMPR